MTVKTFWLIMSLGYCFVSSIAYAETRLSLVNRDLPSPIYRKISELWLNVNTERYRSIQLEFSSETGLVTSDKWIKKFQQRDYSDCSGKCELLIGNLPLPLEKVTCEIKIRMEEFDGKSSNFVFPWGDCELATPKPSERFLADIVIDEESITPDEFSIRNIGAAVQNKKINIAVYIEDENKNVIWADSFQTEISLDEGQSVKVSSVLNIKGWQEHLGCRALVIVDSDYQLHERSKKNNQIEIDYGHCEVTPEVGRGDRFDFEPKLNFANGELSFEVINQGRMSIQWAHEILEYQIFFKDEKGIVIYQIQDSIKAPFYGFGDIKKVLVKKFPEGACQADFVVNYNYLLKESNYQNNVSEISFCNSGVK